MTRSMLVIACMVFINIEASAQDIARGKCLGAPAGGVMLLAADGSAFHMGNIPVPKPVPDIADARAIAVYGNSYLVLRRDGTVLEFRNRGTPQVVSGLSNVVDIALGADHSVALLADSTVRTWGNKMAGLPGDGTCPVRPCDKFWPRDSMWVNRNSPCSCPKGRDNPSELSTPPIKDVVAISAGPRWTHALLKDGTVWGWGIDYIPREEGATIGNPNVHTYALRPVQVVGLSDVEYISSTGGTNHARMRNGTWKFWGSGFGVKPVEIANFKGAVAVTRDVALHADGYVRQVGVKPTGAKLFPERAVALAVEEAPGRNHTALLADGRVILFGHPRLFPNGPVISQMNADQQTLAQCSLLR